MGRWENFSIWRGRLPHWRADGVWYYATFRHRRALDDDERFILYQRLMRAGSRLDFHIVSVLPEKTEAIFTVLEDSRGEAYELSDALEKAKRQAGSKIIKKSGERWPPFYGECFDRIIRDEAEYESLWTAILAGPVNDGHVEDPGDWRTLFVPDAPNR